MLPSDYGFIYLIRNSINGKGYIGKTGRSVSERFSSHKSDALHRSDVTLHRAMRKYGFESFGIEEICKANISLLADLEKYFIKLYATRTSTGGGYNETAGGEGIFGLVHSEEAKRKMSLAHKGRVRPPFSEETRRRMSAARNGMKLSEDHKAKLSASGMGRIHSEETKAKRAAFHKGRKRSEETKARMKVAQLRIVEKRRSA